MASIRLEKIVLQLGKKGTAIAIIAELAGLSESEIKHNFTKNE
jgi:lambda repressor-like predicted transcriptional regulator